MSLVRNALVFAACLPALVLAHGAHADSEVDGLALGSESAKLTTGQVWLAAMVTQTIMALLALLGLAFVPLLARNATANRVVMSLLIGLAAGTLLGDAVIHMLPDALEAAGDDEILRMWTAAVVCAGAYAFFLVEVALNGYRARKESPHTHEHGPRAQEEGHIINEAGLAPDHAVFSGERMHGVNMKESDFDASRVRPVAWLILVGDAVHNFFDGLAVGVSFASSWSLGVSTALAVLFHELPHELGDYAVLLESGIPRLRAAMYNVLCNVSAFVGAMVGILIATAFSESAQAWVIAFTAGGFLYVALSDLVPMLFTMGFPGTAHEHGHTHGHSHGVPVAAATTSAATPAGTIEDGGKPSVAESVSEASALAAAGTVKTPVDTLALVAQNVGLIAGVFVMIGIKLFEHARGV